MVIHACIVPALGRWKQENREFEASLGCIVIPCLKKKKKERKLNEYSEELQVKFLFLSKYEAETLSH
jgi:hypothetical protein